jgi:glutathione S-transferase
MANAKLYHFPGTRSNRARWAIHEVGLEVEEVNVDLFKGEQQQAEYIGVREFYPGISSG